MQVKLIIYDVVVSVEFTLNICSGTAGCRNVTCMLMVFFNFQARIKLTHICPDFSYFPGCMSTLIIDLIVMYAVGSETQYVKSIGLRKNVWRLNGSVCGGLPKRQKLNKLVHLRLTNAL